MTKPWHIFTHFELVKIIQIQVLILKIYITCLDCLCIYDLSFFCQIRSMAIPVVEFQDPVWLKVTIFLYFLDEMMIPQIFWIEKKISTEIP